MSSLNDILTSAATLIEQAETTEDADKKASLQGAARTLLETVNAQLVPGAAPEPKPAPVIDEEDD